MFLLFISGRRSNLDKLNLPGGYVFLLPLATGRVSSRQKGINKGTASSENFFKNWENKEIQIRV
jgi:hypothetical protein